MDVSKELSENSTKKSFFKHVFNMEDDSQKEILNIIQYSLIAIIPILLLNKSVQTFFPEADESKNNIELLMEVVGQTVVMFLGMLLIHRLVTYVPTYSKVDYSPLHITNVVIAFLTIVLSIQSRIGEKANILFDRLMSYFRVSPKETSVTQQPQQSQQPQHGQNTMAPLPPGGNQLNNGMHSPPMQQQTPPMQQGNYDGANSMQNQQQDNSYSLLNSGQDDIMASNEAGMSWGSAF